MVGNCVAPSRFRRQCAGPCRTAAACGRVRRASGRRPGCGWRRARGIRTPCCLGQIASPAICGQGGSRARTEDHPAGLCEAGHGGRWRAGSTTSRAVEPAGPPGAAAGHDQPRHGAPLRGVVSRRADGGSHGSRAHIVDPLRQRPRPVRPADRPIPGDPAAIGIAGQTGRGRIGCRRERRHRRRGGSSLSGARPSPPPKSASGRPPARSPRSHIRCTARSTPRTSTACTARRGGFGRGATSAAPKATGRPSSAAG